MKMRSVERLLGVTGGVEEAVIGADAVLVLTEWQHYRNWIGSLWPVGCASLLGSLMQGLSWILLRSKLLDSACGASATVKVDCTTHPSQHS